MGTQCVMVLKKGQDDVIIHQRYLDGDQLLTETMDWIKAYGTDRKEPNPDPSKIGNGTLDTTIMTIEEWEDNKHVYDCQYQLVVDFMNRHIWFTPMYDVNLNDLVPAVCRWVKDGWTISV